MASKRKAKHEEHQNHEAWAIPYADLITLLLAFFVVMYAISTVNEGKYRVLSNSLIAAFRGTPRALEPIQIGKEQPRSSRSPNDSVIDRSAIEQLSPGGAAHTLVRPVSITTDLPQPAEPTARRIAAAQNAHTGAQARLLERVAAQVVSALQELVRAKLVVVRESPTLVQVEIRTDILFPSGSARLSSSAIPVIERLGRVLEPFPNPVLVEGDTDDRPIHTVAFPSNWELSAARAASVVRRFAGAGVDPTRMAVIGHADYEPVASNKTSAGRNANRRVDVVILAAHGSILRTVTSVAPDGKASPPKPVASAHTLAAK